MKPVHRSYRHKQKMLKCYVLALTLLSFSIILMPIVSKFNDSTKIPMYIVGLLFWTAMILIIITVVRINKSRKRSLGFNTKYAGLKKLGLIHFFQNKNAVIADIIMFGSLIAFVLSLLLAWNTMVQFIFFSMLLFSFGMHCMLNGINYIYIKHKTTVRRN